MTLSLSHWLLLTLGGALSFVLLPRRQADLEPSRSEPSRSEPSRSGALPFLLGLLAAFMVSHLLVVGMPGLIPGEGAGRLTWLVLPLVALAAAFAQRPVRFLPRRPDWPSLVVAVVAPPLVLFAQVRGQWSVPESLTRCLALSLGFVVFSRGYSTVAAGSKSRAAPAIWAITLAGAGLLALFSGSVTIGELGLAWAATAGGAALAGVAPASVLRSRATPALLPGLELVASAWQGLLLLGVFYASVTPAHALVVLLAPFALLIEHLPVLRRAPAWLRGVCAVLVAAAILATLLVPLGRSFFDEVY